MKVRVKIRRFNPEKDRKPYWGEYTVEAKPTDRVLDLLVEIKGYQDGTLTFRRSCAHGVCGSDAMVINGRNRLACKELVQDVGKRVTIEPLRGLPVIKDLAVDMEPFFAHFRAIRPYLINDDPPPFAEATGLKPGSLRWTTKLSSARSAACRLLGSGYFTDGNRSGASFIFDDRSSAQARLPSSMPRWRACTICNCGRLARG
jgi:succinate dehydrogenase / fumarate reductase iron-sulfur subunit